MSKLWLMTGSARGLGRPIAQTREGDYGLPVAAPPLPTPEPRP